MRVGNVKEIVFSKDPKQMNWLREDFPYAEVKCPPEFSAEVQNEKDGDVLTTKIVVSYNGAHPYFTNAGSIGVSFPVKPGDLLFIWPGELHAVSTINREHRLIMLQLDADFLEKRVDFQSVAYLFYQIRLLNQNNFPEIEKLRGFLTELRRLSLSGISFSELRGCVLLYQFFILLGENLSVPTETAAPQKTGHSAQVHRQMIAACTWISSHCTEPVSLEEASKVAGFSRCHFSKLFRAYTGLSFTDFVTRERLHIAENLLKKPDLTITEVSLESGFNSISTFNRVFLKSKNVSPTDFRQMYLQSYQK